MHAACRLYVINRCPRLKVLDFRKVKQKVRLGPAACGALPLPALSRAACCLP